MFRIRTDYLCFCFVLFFSRKPSKQEVLEQRYIVLRMASPITATPPFSPNQGFNAFWAGGFGWDQKDSALTSHFTPMTPRSRRIEREREMYKIYLYLYLSPCLYAYLYIIYLPARSSMCPAPDFGSPGARLCPPRPPTSRYGAPLVGL